MKLLMEKAEAIGCDHKIGISFNYHDFIYESEKHTDGIVYDCYDELVPFQKFDYCPDCGEKNTHAA